MTTKHKRTVTRKEFIEWLMRKDTEIGLRPTAHTGWEWRADAQGLFWATSKFAAIRKAILAERKCK